MPDDVISGSCLAADGFSNNKTFLIGSVPTQQSAMRYFEFDHQKAV